MCGIIGYTGAEPNATALIMNGLHRLEYRGYDSAGIAVFTGKKGKEEIKTVRVAGRVSALDEELKKSPLKSDCGIGHTRWATHGAPTSYNCHPHMAGRTCLCHNGIIENYRALRARLSALGYVFKSETDTEAAAALIDYYYSQSNDPIKALRAAVSELEGSYALAVIFSNRESELYGIKKDSPMLVGLGEGANFLTSDITAVLDSTRRYIILSDGELVHLTRDSAEIYDADGYTVAKEVLVANFSGEAAQKNGYPHFMLKEINEEPEALRKSLAGRICNQLPDFSVDGVSDEFLAGINEIKIVACGTAMHAGLYAQQVIEELAKLPVSVETASQYRSKTPLIRPGDAVLIISQSGETADSIAALRISKQLGAKIIGLVNVFGSTVARESDYVIYTYAGPEIAVASTKAYTVQTSVLLALAIKLGLVRKTLDESLARELTMALSGVFPGALADIIADSEKIRGMASRICRALDMFFIGRGIDWCAAEESSLKVKEITYIHSEAYPAGELKHGTISLITPEVPVVAISTRAALAPKTGSNLKEAAARGGKAFSICGPDAVISESEPENTYILPNLPEPILPIAAVTVSQILAYYTAVMRGCDVDKPRNLAKSVTVE